MKVRRVEVSVGRREGGRVISKEGKKGERVKETEGN